MRGGMMKSSLDCRYALSLISHPSSGISWAEDRACSWGGAVRAKCRGTVAEGHPDSMARGQISGPVQREGALQRRPPESTITGGGLAEALPGTAEPSAFFHSDSVRWGRVAWAAGSAC